MDGQQGWGRINTSTVAILRYCKFYILIAAVFFRPVIAREHEKKKRSWTPTPEITNMARFVDNKEHVHNSLPCGARNGCLGHRLTVSPAFTLPTDPHGPETQAWLRQHHISEKKPPHVFWQDGCACFFATPRSCRVVGPQGTRTSELSLLSKSANDRRHNYHTNDEAHKLSSPRQ